MDLDVRMKAVLLGATFLIVSYMTAGTEKKFRILNRMQVNERLNHTICVFLQLRPFLRLHKNVYVFPSYTASASAFFSMQYIIINVDACVNIQTKKMLSVY